MLKLGDIKEFSKMHPRHIIQSILVFTCFCSVDTKLEHSGMWNIWLASAIATVVAIAAAMIVSNYLYERAEGDGVVLFGKWTNALPIIAAALLVGSHFFEYLYPFAVVFIVLEASVRLIYARNVFGDYCTVAFIVGSVFIAIVLRFIFVDLPIWTVAILMLTTLFNPIITKEKAQAQVATTKNKNIIKITAAVILICYLICIEIFGGPITDAVKHDFPLQMLNFAYLCGFVLAIASIMTIDIKTISIAVMTSSVTGLFLYLIPNFKVIGIYFLLFIGGAIKVLMLSFPVAAFPSNKRLYGAFGGVFIYRLAFLFDGIAERLAGENWEITSNFSYTFAAINISLALILIFFLLHWDRQANRAIVEERVRAEISAPKPLPNCLSLREKEVANLILSGYNTEEIALKLFIADSTTRTHIKSILRKTDCQTQRAFILRYNSHSE